MKLTVEWVNPTRLPEEKRTRERIFLERLIDLTGSPDYAFSIKEQWHRQQEPVLHPWGKYIAIAHDDAVSGLLPSEKRLAAFIVRFSE